MQKCLAVDPKDRIAMAIGEGLEYIRGLRKAREEMSRTVIVRPELWTSPQTAEPQDDMDIDSGDVDVV